MSRASQRPEAWLCKPIQLSWLSQSGSALSRDLEHRASLGELPRAQESGIRQLIQHPFCDILSPLMHIESLVR